MTRLPLQELKALISINRLRIGGGRQARTLLKEGILPSEVLHRMETGGLPDKAGSFAGSLKDFDPEREIELAGKMSMRFLAYSDSEYPYLLSQIPDPPVLLYMLGDIAESDQAALAIVGSRHPSFYGITQAKKFARELCEAGFTIVSGLARGIDQAAHEASLQISYGRSLAVMGCGLDKIYPPENRALYEKIIHQGAVLSEFPLGTPPRAENFPRRNRIISGLSLGVLVVEAHSRSGSLITAHEAVDQGREVFAIPGPIDQLTSRGTHRLLKEGALLVENMQDIVEALNTSGYASILCPILSSAAAAVPPGISQCKSRPEAAADLYPGEFTENHKKVMEALCGGPLVYEEIARLCAFPVALTVSLLLELELKKEILKDRDGRFALTRR